MNADVLRGSIAAWLVGSTAASSPAELVEAHGIECVLQAIEREGVVSLVHARFADPGFGLALPESLRTTIAARARVSAARRLLCLAEARRIQQALDTAGIQALWLKGMAVGQWLYPQPHLRDIADIDLLLPDHASMLRAADVLAPLGYVLPNPYIAGDLVVHELLAWSARAQLELDLHWDLSNAALFAARLGWVRLVADAMALPGLAEGARGLSPVHVFLHACLHRAVNTVTGRQDRLRWLYDIHRLATSLDPTQWDLMVREATDSGLADACADALRASRRVFATSFPDALLHALDAAASDEGVRTAQLGNWTYLQMATWRSLPNLRTRLRWLRQLLFPDIMHLQVRYGADGAGRMRLLWRRAVDGVSRWRAWSARSLPL